MCLRYMDSTNACIVDGQAHIRKQKIITSLINCVINQLGQVLAGIFVFIFDVLLFHNGFV